MGDHVKEWNLSKPYSRELVAEVERERFRARCNDARTWARTVAEQGEDIDVEHEHEQGGTGAVE